jgi:hypothetical protein
MLLKDKIFFSICGLIGVISISVIVTIIYILMKGVLSA